MGNKKKIAGVGDGNRSTARAQLHIHGDICHYMVYDSEGKVVFQDDTGSGGWQNLINDASRRVGALREVENAGHRLIHSYPSIVNMARD